ncbi:MAG TPA: hypothetical protein VEY70_24675 [Metabacillus sp.]|nr:hypothetical protein [Metabacillus sp.]
MCLIPLTGVESFLLDTFEVPLYVRQPKTVNFFTYVELFQEITLKLALEEPQVELISDDSLPYSKEDADFGTLFYPTAYPLATIVIQVTRTA